MGKAIRKRERSTALHAAAQELSNLTTKIGFFETAKYPDGTPVAYVASVHEFGSAKEGIPPRSFMRSTANTQGAAWRDQFAKGARAIADGRFTGRQVMESVGLLAGGDIRKTISELSSPPLKDATIKARKRRYKDKKTTGNLAKPLVDTAVMVNAVTVTVEDGGQEVSRVIVKDVLG